MEIRGPIGRRNSYLARVGIYFQFEVADVAAIHDARASKLVIGTAVLHGCETRGTAPRHGTFLLREVFLSYTPCRAAITSDAECAEFAEPVDL